MPNGGTCGTSAWCSPGSSSRRWSRSGGWSPCGPRPAGSSRAAGSGGGSAGPGWSSRAWSWSAGSPVSCCSARRSPCSTSCSSRAATGSSTRGRTASSSCSRSRSGSRARSPSAWSCSRWPCWPPGWVAGAPGRSSRARRWPPRSGPGPWARGERAPDRPAARDRDPRLGGLDGADRPDHVPGRGAGGADGARSRAARPVADRARDRARLPCHGRRPRAGACARRPADGRSHERNRARVPGRHGADVDPGPAARRGAGDRGRRPDRVGPGGADRSSVRVRDRVRRRDRRACGPERRPVRDRRPPRDRARPRRPGRRRAAGAGHRVAVADRRERPERPDRGGAARPRLGGPRRDHPRGAHAGAEPDGRHVRRAVHRRGPGQRPAGRGWRDRAGRRRWPAAPAPAPQPAREQAGRGSHGRAARRPVPRARGRAVAGDRPHEPDRRRRARGGGRRPARGDGHARVDRGADGAQGRGPGRRDVGGPFATLAPAAGAVSGDLLSVEAAQASVLAGVEPVEQLESLAPEAALGRVLAAPVAATTSLPPWDNSAMDGYAIRAADVAGAADGRPVRLTVVGEVRAGSAPDARVLGGTAIRIATGAPLPPGADAVIPVEQTTPLDANGVAGPRGREAVGPLPEACLVHEAVAPGNAVRSAGSDVVDGHLLLAAGVEVTPAVVALVAGAGVASVQVRRRAVAAVLATGDEVRAAGTDLGPAGIPDANGPGLRSLVREAGGDPLDLGIALDRLEDVEDRLRRGVTGADIVIVSGGVSVGPYDVVRTAFDRIGHMDLWRGAGQPGKTVAFGRGRAHGRGPPGLLFGLPRKP